MCLTKTIEPLGTSGNATLSIHWRRGSAAQVEAWCSPNVWRILFAEMRVAAAKTSWVAENASMERTWVVFKKITELVNSLAP